MPGPERDDAPRTPEGGGAGASEAAHDAALRLRGKRAGHGVIITVAVVFIGASAAQIIPAVFGWAPLATAPGSAPPPADEACVRGVRSLVAALDRAGNQAWVTLEAPGLTAGEPEREGSSVFEHALLPEWSQRDAVERACSGSTRGRDAWAALQRLRQAEGEVLGRGRGELVPLRDQVAAHLGADLR